MFIFCFLLCSNASLNPYFFVQKGGFSRYADSYHNIKKEEGFDSRDLYAAVERDKRIKEYQSTSGLEKDEEEKEDDKEYEISDDDSRWWEQ